MLMLKWKSAKGWVSLYADALRNRLRRDKNLSDVTNVEESRKSLGLDGENNATHFHDDRYVPLIENSKNVCDKQLNEMKEKYDNEIAKLLELISDNTRNINDIKSTTEWLTRKLYVGAEAPSNVTEGFIWFCTSGQPVVKYFSNGSWYNFGSDYI